MFEFSVCRRGAANARRHFLAGRRIIFDDGSAGHRLGRLVRREQGLAEPEINFTVQRTVRLFRPIGKLLVQFF